MTQHDETVPPAVPVAANRRGWVIAGGAFAVAAVGIVATGGPFACTDVPTAPALALSVAATPVNEPPTVNAANPAAEEIARGFLDAYATFDAQKAMTYVADEADLTGVNRCPGSGEHRRAVADALPPSRPWVTYRPSPRVRRPPSGPTRASSAITTSAPSGLHQIGRVPFSGSSFVFTVRDGYFDRPSFAAMEPGQVRTADGGALRGVGLLDVPEGRRRHVPGRDAVQGASGSRRSRSVSGSGTLASTWRK